jgi:hypothetical protein
MKKCFFILAFLLSANAWANMPVFNRNDCDTHEVCTMDKGCECTIPPDSAYQRFYYADFADIEKGHTYQCHFGDSLGILSVVLEGSQFPAGSNYKDVTGEYSRFPFDITLDTTGMNVDVGKMIIKYFVPTSDMPTTMKANCSILS